MPHGHGRSRSHLRVSAIPNTLCTMSWFTKLFSDDPSLAERMGQRIKAHSEYQSRLDTYQRTVDAAKAAVDDKTWKLIIDLENAVTDQHALVEEAAFDAGFALGMAHRVAGDFEALPSVAGIVFDQQLSHKSRVGALLGAALALTQEMEQGFHLNRS